MAKNKIGNFLMQKEAQAKRQDIQYLRAFSVCIVVFFHARREYQPNGYLGVDLFFMISGFVLTPNLVSIYSSNKSDVLRVICNFLLKRFNRLIPAFLCSLTITLFILLIFQSINTVRQTLQQALLSLLFLGNLGAESLVGNYFSPKPNPYLHFWSLSAEWQIYFFVPALFLTIRLFTQKYSPSLRSILICLIVGSLLLKFSNLGADSLTGYYSPITRIWQFAIGVLSYLHFNGKSSGIAIKRIARVVLAASVLALISNYELSNLAGAINVTFVFLALIHSQLSMSNSLGDLLSWIGDRSYSIYLFHLPFLYVAIHSPLSGTTELSRALGVVIGLIATFTLAEVCYIQVETKQTKFFSRSKIFPIIYILLVSICSLGVLYSANSVTFQKSEKTTVAWNTSGQCMDGFQKNCVIVNPDSYAFTVFVVGDSHVQQYFSSLRDFGMSQQIRFVYSTTYSVADAEKNVPAIVLYSNFHQSADENSLKMFEEEMKLIHKSGAQILYVGDNPVFLDYLQYSHFINPSFLSRALDHFGITPTPETEISILNLDQDALLAGKKFKEVAQKYSLTIDPYEFVCDLDSCSRRRFDGWLYWDNHHFSEIGASLVSKSIERGILQLLKIENFD